MVVMYGCDAGEFLACKTGWDQKSNQEIMQLIADPKIKISSFQAFVTKVLLMG